MTTEEWWRLLAISSLTVLGVAAYQLTYGDVVVMSKHRFEVELTAMGLDGYQQGDQSCRNRYHGRLRSLDGGERR